MALDFNIFSDDFENLRDDWPTNFYHKNSLYVGILSEVTIESELQEGGFVESFDATLSILVADFTIMPKEGQTVTIGTDVYRIGKVAESPEGKVATLFLISPET